MSAPSKTARAQHYSADRLPRATSCPHGRFRVTAQDGKRQLVRTSTKRTTTAMPLTGAPMRRPSWSFASLTSRGIRDLLKLKILRKQALSAPESNPVKELSALEQLLASWMASFEKSHRPVALVMASAYLLNIMCQLSGEVHTPAWLCTALGGVVGLLFASLNQFGVVRLWREPCAALRVVVTGGTRGIGKAMAREFLEAGDKVFVTGRSPQAVRAAIMALRAEVGPHAQISGIECDITSPSDVDRLVSQAQAYLGSVDVWVNNAGYSGSFQSFLQMTNEQLQQVVQTNLTGTMLCSRAALRCMMSQPSGGHVFNMDGAGADGTATPMYTAYGATKAGVAHLMHSIANEIDLAPSSSTGPPPHIGFHTLSPGMVLTDLLLEGATVANKQVFNILCEQPETVAAYLVSRARTAVARRATRTYTRYLTTWVALLRFVTAYSRVGRYFDAEGNRVYASEHERIMGRKAKHTARLARNARSRSRELGYVYSASIALAFLAMAVNSNAVLPS